MDDAKGPETITETLETPITRTYDVIVVGGGPAGCCAALASARKGARTLLVERQAYLGGMLTGGMVGSSGIYTVSPSTLEHNAEIRRRLGSDPDSVQLIKGIPREIMRRLISSGGGIGYFGEVPAYVCVHVPSFKKLLLDMMEEAGADLLFYAQGVKPIVDGERVGGVIVQGKGGREALRAKVVVDATGDGDVAAAAGADFHFGRPQDGEAINMTLMFTMGGIDMEAYFAAEIKGEATWPPRTMDEHFADMRAGNSYWFGSGSKLSERPGVSAGLRERIDEFVWSTDRTRGHIFACNSPIPGELSINVTEVFKRSGTSSWELTDAVKIAHKQVDLLATMYRAVVPGFQDAYIREIAPLMGVRETRRITGDYILTGDDVRQSRKFDDGVAGSSHPIDTSEDNQGRFEKLSGGAWFEVPYRSLLVNRFENILTAGRCVSTDHDAIGSVRPTAVCMALGEAAGTAAAMAVEADSTPRQLDGRNVRREIGWGAVPLADLTQMDAGEGAGPMLQRENE